MKRIQRLCGEGCLTIVEGRWYWMVAMAIVDRIPAIPFKVWCWFYDHTTESVWQPGHIGERIEED